MAGATNRAMKAAGLPRKTQETVRVALGAGMTVQSAIRHAQAHGLPLGKAKGGEVTGWQKAAAGATTPAEHRAAHEAHAASRKAAMLSARQNRVAGSLDAAGKRMLTGRMVSAMMSRQLATQQAADAQKAAMGARQNRVAGALGAASKGMLASRKAAAKPALSALDRYRQQVRATASEKERSDLSAMTASVRDNMAAGRAALAASAKPRGGLERTVVRGFVDRKASVQNVRAIAKSGDFFVHKTGGFSSGYGVTHRPSGTTIYQSHSLGATKAAMDGVAKTGSKILSRIEGGDLRAAKALQRYRRGLSSADFYNKAHRKYG